MKVFPLAFFEKENDINTIINLERVDLTSTYFCYPHSLSCGFPSPADDYIETMPSLNELLIKHPSATILARAQGQSMVERGIMDGSLLIIDRALEPKHNDTIVASLHSELTVKILDLQNKQLLPANIEHSPIPLPDDIDVFCEGVVTYCITSQQAL